MTQLTDNAARVPLSARWDDAQQRWVLGNGDSRDAAFNGDGTLVAWTSKASNLTPLDLDTDADILLRVLGSRENQLLVPAGTNGEHTHPLFVGPNLLVFSSTSTNLVAGARPTDGKADLFIAQFNIGPAGQMQDVNYVQLTEDAGAIPLGTVELADPVPHTAILVTAELDESAAPWTHALYRLDEPGDVTLLLRTQAPITAARGTTGGGVVVETRSVEIDANGNGVDDLVGGDTNAKEDLFLWRPIAGSDRGTVIRLTDGGGIDAAPTSIGTRLVGDSTGDGGLVIVTDVVPGSYTLRPQPTLVQLQPTQGAALPFEWNVITAAGDGDLGRLGAVHAAPLGAVQFAPAGNNRLLSAADEADTQAVDGEHAHLQVLPLMLDARQLGVDPTDLIGTAPAVLFETRQAADLQFDVPTSGANTSWQLVLAAQGVEVDATEVASIDYSPGSALNPLNELGQPAELLLDIPLNRVTEIEAGGSSLRFQGPLSERLGREPIGAFEPVLVSLPWVTHALETPLGDDLIVGGLPMGYSQAADWAAGAAGGAQQLPVEWLHAVIGSEAGHDRLVLKGDRYTELWLWGGVDEVVFAPAASLATVTVGSFNANPSLVLGQITGSIGTDVLEMLPRLGQLPTAQDVDLRTTGFSSFGGSDTRDLVRLDNWVGTVHAPASVAMQVRSGVADDGSAGVTFTGGTGIDLLIAGPGADDFNGELGADIIDYRGSPGAVQVDLNAGTVSGGWADGDNVRSVQDVHGSDLSNIGLSPVGDFLVGGAQNNALWGWAGDDNLNGNAGNDSLRGGVGNDRLDGGPDNDLLAGGPGNDILIGGPGVDTVVVPGHSRDFSLIALFPISGFDYEMNDLRLAAPEGTDRLVGVEWFQFSDGTYSAEQLLARPPLPGVSIEPITSRLSLTEGNPGDTPPSFQIVLQRALDLSNPVDVWVVLEPDNAPGASSMDADDIEPALQVASRYQFAAGADRLTIPVTVRTDLQQEPAETLRFSLLSVSHGTLGAQTEALLTLRDDDGRLVTIDAQAGILRAIEGSAGASSQWQVQLRRTGDLAEAVSVDWSIEPDPAAGAHPAGPTDYDVPQGRGVVTFPVGQSVVDVVIPLRGDALHEGDETALFRLLGASNAALGSARSVVLAIQDDDPLPVVRLIGPPASEIVEGSGGVPRVAEFRLVRSGDLSPASTVSFRLAGDGTITDADLLSVSIDDRVQAQAGLQAYTASFAAGQVELVVKVAIAGDSQPEPDEGFAFELLSATNATLDTAGSLWQAITIRDDDGPTPADLSLQANVWVGGVAQSGTSFGFDAGETFTLKVTVRNDGPGSAPGVIVQVPVLPGAFEVVSTLPEDADAVPGGSAYVWTLPTLAAAASSSFEVTLRTLHGGQFVFNPQILAAGAPDPDSVPGNGVSDQEDDHATLTITVENTPPIDPEGDDAALALTTAEDTSLIVSAATLLADDRDPEGGPVVLAEVTAGAGTASVRIRADGAVEWVPLPEFHGLGTFFYRARDAEGALSAPVTVPVDVASVNDPPVATDDRFVMTGRSILVVDAPGLLGNDSDADGDTLRVQFPLDTTGLRGTISSASSSGQFSYSLPADFAGETGFTYTVTDGHGGVDQGRVTIVVTNSPPLALDDEFIAQRGQVLHIANPGVLGNDSDPDGDPILMQTVPDTTGLRGVLSQVAAQGGFEYTPEPGFVGTTSFRYTVTDPRGGLAQATVTIKFQNEPPAAVDDVFTTRSGQALQIPLPGVLANDLDPDGDALRVQFPVDTAGLRGTLVSFSAGGGFEFQPEPGFIGTTSFRYAVADVGALVDHGEVTIVVQAANRPPIARDDHYVVPRGQALLQIGAPGLLGNDSDSDGDTLGIHMPVDTAGLRGGLQSVLVNGGFVYRPEPGFLGSTSFRYTARDPDGGTSAPATVTISIANEPPVAVDDVFVTQPGQALQIPLPGVLANDHDPDGDALRMLLSLDTAGLRGALVSVTAGGGFVFVPEPGFTGRTSFRYTVADAGDLADQGEVTIQVRPGANTPPVAGDIILLRQPGATQQVPLATLAAASTDADGETLTFGYPLPGSAGSVFEGVTDVRAQPGFGHTLTFADASGRTPALATYFASDFRAADPGTIWFLPAAPALDWALTLPAHIDEGRPLTLGLQASRHFGDAQNLRYVLDWGDGSAPVVLTQDQFDAAGGTFQHAFDDATGGSSVTPYTVRVDVRDQVTGAVSTLEHELLVNDLAPRLDVSGPAWIEPGTPYVLNLGSYADIGGDGALGLVVDWGDGSSPTVLQGSTPASLTHLFPTRLEQHDIRVSVRNDDGEFVVDSQPVHVLARMGGVATATPAQYQAAWTDPALAAILHTANLAGNATPTPVTFSTVNSGTLAGGDIFALGGKGLLGVSGQTATASTVRQEVDGTEALLIQLAPGQRANTLVADLAMYFGNEAGGTVREGLRMLAFSGGTLVAEQRFASAAADGREREIFRSPVEFDRIVLQAGSTAGGPLNDLSMPFLPGGVLSPALQGLAPTASVASDFLLDGLWLLNADTPIELLGLPAYGT